MFLELPFISVSIAHRDLANIRWDINPQHPDEMLYRVGHVGLTGVCQVDLSQAGPEFGCQHPPQGHHM